MKKSLYILCTALFVISCKPELDIPVPSQGNTNFTTYVAIGNSLTAGYSDNALYYKGQMYSYPNMIAQQIKLAGGAQEFNIPFVSSISNGSGSDPVKGRLYLGQSYSCDSILGLGPLAHPADPSIFATNIYASDGPFHNLGAPGAKGVHIAYPRYGDPSNPLGYNPFYARFASSATSSILQDALSVNPTFFTLWVGGNDILFYATSGGKAGDVPGTGQYNYTPTAMFEGSIKNITDSLAAIGAKGMIINIPDVTNVPFFTTVPIKGLPLSAEQADQLNFIYGASEMSFVEGNNYWVVEDSTSPIGRRQIKEGEYLLLTVPQNELKCEFMGSMGDPIPDQYVLDSTEAAIVKNQTLEYNNILKKYADFHDFGYIDMNSYLSTFKSGIVYDGVSLNASFVSGGGFSLDGVHPCAKGYALIANKIIMDINAKYGSTLPPVQVNDYPCIVFP